MVTCCGDTCIWLVVVTHASDLLWWHMHLTCCGDTCIWLFVVTHASDLLWWHMHLTCCGDTCIWLVVVTHASDLLWWHASDFLWWHMHLTCGDTCIWLVTSYLLCYKTHELSERGCVPFFRNNAKLRRPVVLRLLDGANLHPAMEKANVCVIW